MNANHTDPAERPEQYARRCHRELERLIRWYFPPQEHAMALYVCWSFSNMNAGSYHPNGGPGIGLFDIDPSTVGIKPGDAWRLQMPIVNVAAAHKLWSEHGWRAWAVAPPEPPFADDEKAHKE